MYKYILKGFASLIAVLASLRAVSFALLLADQSSDNAVLGGIGIILLVVLADTFLFRTLFAPKSKERYAASD